MDADEEPAASERLILRSKTPYRVSLALLAVHLLSVSAANPIRSPACAGDTGERVTRAKAQSFKNQKRQNLLILCVSAPLREKIFISDVSEL